MTEKKIPKTAHYLFDFDGTLVDSMPHWGDSMTRMLESHGISCPEDIIRIITPLGLLGTARHFISMGLCMSEEEVMTEMRRYLVPVYRDIVPEKKGVRDCLVAMKAGGIGLHVLTASPHLWLDPCLKRLGLYDLFDNVWSCDDFGTGKTNPDIYTAAARRIGAAVEDITFLDDNINANRTAKQAGMPVVGVFDAVSAVDEEAMRELTDAYIVTFRELAAGVCGQNA